jgi:hypothetical protein
VTLDEQSSFLTTFETPFGRLFWVYTYTYFATWFLYYY